MSTWAPRLALVLVLGCSFVYFLGAGSRTFTRSGADDIGATWAQISFMWTGALATLFLGLYVPIRLYNGLASAAVLLCSLVLYEWARSVVWGRNFHVAWSGNVPESVCEDGPYAYIRHPIYTAYILAFLAVLIAMPTMPTVVVFAFNVALFTHAAASDERSLKSSPLAAEYAQYSKRTGMFFPRIVRPGSDAA